MSDEAKTQDWSKPAAMAIPKGGIFKDKVEQAMVRYFPRVRPAMDFPFLPKSFPVARRCFTTKPRPSKRRSRRSLRRLRC
jgi:hypothetical protein